MSRETAKSDIVQINTRQLSESYGNQIPEISVNQDLLIVPRLKNFGNRTIDIYDCEKEEFFLSKEEINTEDPNFICSLSITREFSKTYKKVVTSNTTKKIILVLGSDYILQYNISAMFNGSLNAPEPSERIVEP